jgi:hypothetical protein
MLDGSKPRTRVKRIDGDGRAFAGSRRQIQTYVNEKPEVLTGAIRDAYGSEFPSGATVKWVSPLKSQKYIEYRDADFLRVLGLEKFSLALSTFWPNRGPCWDALARVDHGRDHGCILVEAKSHVPELYANDTRAAGASLDRIRRSLHDAKRWAGVPENIPWSGFSDPNCCPYQLANRLAHLLFLRGLGVSACLVSVCFTNDWHSPTTVEEWQIGLAKVKKQLGIADIAIPGYKEVFLPAFA